MNSRTKNGRGLGGSFQAPWFHASFIAECHFPAKTFAPPQFSKPLKMLKSGSTCDKARSMLGASSEGDEAWATNGVATIAFMGHIGIFFTVSVRSFLKAPGSKNNET